MKHDLTTYENKVDKSSEEEPATISEISDPQIVQHLYTGFSLTPILSVVDDSLPYHQLGGQGLERLCYSLILARGGVPRYFGNSGQEQYGIDLLEPNGDECTVYQCKNVKSFTWQNMGEALDLFEKKWLGQEQLPKPAKFVLCCPLPLRERIINKKWTVLESEFLKRTGVRIEAWDKGYLDSQLKKHPDIVSDLFSAQAAERFCDLADWNEDLFRPIRPGSGVPMVNRYLEKKAAGQLYIDARLTEDFTQRLERHGSLLILGLPGSGKTTTGLALAESFRHGLYRVFYINMRRDLSEDTLVKGIRRRLARPTIFLIDDCHGKYEDILEGAHDRLQEVLARQPGRALLLYVARTTPTPEDMPRADYAGFVEEFKKAEAVLEFSPTPELFASIAALTKPDLRELSEERSDRIFSVTGRDLFLLDHLLDTIKSPDEIDRLKPEHLFEGTLLRYFGQPTVHRPGFMMLTALAQFEIAPAVADFPHDLRREDPKAATQLLVEADRPLRYFFLHSSAAELVFRALAWNDRIDNHAEAAALKLIEFFGSRPATEPKFPADLSSVLRNRLKLCSDGGEEYLLKSLFLGDDDIFALVEAAFECLSLNTVALLLNILRSTDVATFERYRDLVQRKIDDGAALKALIASFPSQFLQLIKNEYPLWYYSLREQFAKQGLRQWVRTRGIQSLLRFLATLAGLRDFLSDDALDSVSDDEFDGLIQRTITSGRFTVHWQLLGLKNTDLPLLEKLVLKIGTQRFLRLIVSTGTVSDVFHVMKFFPQPMIVELIEALDDETLDSLTKKTIATGRSIGTIHLALRKLKEADADLLEGLERKIGAQRYLQLIVGVGTVSDLFGVIKYSSPSMAAELIEALDDETLDSLTKKTIATGRSIGTIHLALRKLKEADADLLEGLERKIGAQRYLQLIVGVGTVFELFRVIEYSSPSMAAELIEALDDETLDSLTKKTIATGRSIATINLALRELKEADADLLEGLERKIGAQRYLQLIVGVGTVFELFRVIQYSSPSMAAELIEALDDKTVNDLIEKTITSGRSIGTLSFTLRQLKISGRGELNRLERRIGVDGWWKLILANGKINVLAPLMKYMDDPFRQEMVQASRRLTTAGWERFLLRGDFSDLTVFARIGEGYSPKLFTTALIKLLSPTFEKLIHTADWPTLHLGAYRLSESPDSQLNGHLQSILGERLAETEIASLRLNTFEEAARYIGSLWRIIPSKRDKLIQSFFSILPNEDTWYKDASFLRAAREPLFVLATSHSQHDIDRRMLESCNNRNVAALCVRAGTLDILLYLWNLYSLWFKSERVVKNEAGASFATFLDPEIRACVNRILGERLRSRTDQLEKELLVSLCGFLYASGLANFSKEDKAVWLSSLLPFDELLAKAEGMKSFLVASFLLIGLGWVSNRDIPRLVFSRVMSKASLYEERTDAFSNLLRLLSARVR